MPNKYKKADVTFKNNDFEIWEGATMRDLGQPGRRLGRLPGQTGRVGWLAGWLAG